MTGGTCRGDGSLKPILLLTASVLALTLSAGIVSAQTRVDGGNTRIVSASNWSVAPYVLFIGDNGAGTLIIENGGRVTSSNGYIGNSGSHGAVTVRGPNSRWDDQRQVIVGFQSSGTLLIENGGTVRNGYGTLVRHGWIGYEAGAEGIVNVTGSGSIWDSVSDLVVGREGTASLTLSHGGSVRTGGSLIIASKESGEGTLNIGAGAGDEATTPGIVQSAEVYFGVGKGTLTFNHTDANYEFGASLASAESGTHAINHLAGTTILTGDSSGFTGTTTVSGGTLIVSNALGGNVDVSGNGTIAGGRIGGNLALGSGGVLEGSQGRTLTVTGDLTLATDSEINVTLGGAPTPALFDVGGNLTLSGTLNVADQGGFGVGVYRLFDYAGGLTDNGFLVGQVPGGLSPADLFIQTADSGHVNLVTSAGVELSFWDGGDTALHDNAVVDGGDGVWQVSGNWTNDTGALNGPYRPNPTFAIFQGSAGTVAVDESAVAIGVTGMQFAADGYRIKGGAIALKGTDGETTIRVGDGSNAGEGMSATIGSALTGDSTLVKADHGTLILSGLNTYTGGTVLREGTLQVSADDKLGHTDGRLTFAGGTLAVSDSFESTRGVTFDATGSFEVADGSTLGLHGTVTGPGDLLKRGAGTLALTNAANTYGNTRVAAGTLIGHADSISGHISNAGTVVFDQEDDGSFAGNIGGLDGDNGQMIKEGAGTLTLTGMSTLDWIVVEGGLVSTTDRFSGNLDLAEGTTFTFHQSHSGSYAGTISGDGRILFTGGGIVELTGDASEHNAKESEVTDSTLVVNGTLGGSAVIGSGGRLSGAGTIGSGNGAVVTIGSGGAIAPGNSIGTLHVDGDFVFDAGSTYEVEVAPGGTDSDLIEVTGTATLSGGSVVHFGMGGNYAPTATYTILTADGGVNGEFSGVRSNFAFLDPILGYSNNDVTLTLQRNDIDFTDVATTRNQIATAASLNGLAFGNALYDAVVQTDEATARAAFDQLSGEIHASVKTGLIEDSRHIRNAANDRLRAGLGASGHHGGIGAWGTAFGSWGRSDGDGNAATLSRSTTGFVAGIDGRIHDAWRVGLLAGYSRSSFDVDDRRSAADSDNNHLGLYGGTEWGPLALRGGLAYTWHDLDTSRSVAFDRFVDKLTASYDAGTFQGFGEVGYRIHTGMVSLEPFANLAYVDLRTDGFTECGGAGALASTRQSTDVTFSVIGLRAKTELAFGATRATLRGMAGWQHAFGDTAPLSTHAFAGSDTFTIAGAPIAEDLAVVEAGLDLDLAAEATLDVRYQGRFGADARDNGFNARLSVRF